MRRPIAFILGFVSVLVGGISTTVFFLGDSENGLADAPQLAEIDVPSAPTTQALVWSTEDMWKPDYVDGSSQPAIIGVADVSGEPEDPDEVAPPFGEGYAKGEDWDEDEVFDWPSVITWNPGECVHPGPPLTIAFPADGQVFTDTNALLVSGYSDPGTVVQVQRVSGIHYNDSVANANGHWIVPLEIYPGINDIVVTAFENDNEIGFCTKKYFSVSYEGPVSEWDVIPIEWEDYRYSGYENWIELRVVSEEGDQISITSPYGSASGTIKDGEVVLRVDFSGNALLEKFFVEVHDQRGRGGGFSWRWGRSSPWSATQESYQGSVSWNGLISDESSTNFQIHGDAGERVVAQSEWGYGEVVLDNSGYGYLWFEVNEGTPARIIPITLIYKGQAMGEYSFDWHPAVYGFGFWSLDPETAVEGSCTVWVRAVGTPGATVSIVADYGGGSTETKSLVVEDDCEVSGYITLQNAPLKQLIPYTATLGSDEVSGTFYCPGSPTTTSTTTSTTTTTTTVAD